MSTSTPQALDIPDGDMVFYPSFFPQAEADRLLQELLTTTVWRQERIKLYGKLIDVPRLTAWCGEEGTGYTYSGIVNEPQPWTPALLEVKRSVEVPAGVTFNSALVNRYRSGKDSVAWHSDDEEEFGNNPVIASVSFGGTRTFQFKHKKRKNVKASVELTHGSLLIMRGATQHNWVHQIPKTAKDVPERVNLTYRVVRAKGTSAGPARQAAART
jgi:alkylated DNA repair dioxygenase AlkB